MGLLPPRLRHPYFLSRTLSGSQAFKEGGGLQPSWGWCLTPCGMWNARTPRHVHCPRGGACPLSPILPQALVPHPSGAMSSCSPAKTPQGEARPF